MQRLRRLVVLLIVLAALTPILFDRVSPATADEAGTPVADVEFESTPVPSETASPTEEPTTAATEPATPAATDVPAAPTATPTTVATEAPVVEAASDGEVVAAAVTPGLSLSASEGVVGATVRVEVRNFPAFKRVAIYFDGARKVTLETNDIGKARGSITIPAAALGAHTIEAAGSGKRASKTFTVLPKLAISPSTVTAGGKLTATLTGFSPNTTAKIRLYDINNSSTAVSVWTAAIDASGGSKVTVTTKTSTKAGSHQVVATDTPTRATSAVSVTVTRPAPTATAAPTIRVVVSVNCYSNPELTTITNQSSVAITIYSVGSIYDPRSGEPYGVSRQLAPGQSITYQTGAAASSNKLTGQYIYNNDVGTAEGARVTTDRGTFENRC